MESNNEFYEGENEEEVLDIEQENQKLIEQLTEGLKALKEKDQQDNKEKTEKESNEKKDKEKENNLDIVKAFKAQLKLEKKSEMKDFNLEPKSSKSLYNRLNEIQNELNSVSKEIKDYLQIYGDNSLLKEESSYNDALKDLELYSTKLQNIMSSDVYKNSISGKNQITNDTNQLKEEIKINLENYTNSTARLMGLINKEKEDFMINNSINSINTTSHDMFINKNMFDDNKLNINLNSNVENEIAEIEKELTRLENIVGKKKLNKNEELNFNQIIKQLTKTVQDSLFQSYKEKSLEELNIVLDELLNEKEISKEISEYSLKIKELYSIYEVYENYDEILQYIKKRLMAISDMHEKSTNFNSDLEFLKKLIEDNEKQFEALGKRYNEAFDELGGLDEILKELKVIDNYFAPLLVD
jgi:uncharacterized coiled-coil DUF342 family protein